MKNNRLSSQPVKMYTVVGEEQRERTRWEDCPEKGVELTVPQESPTQLNQKYESIQGFAMSLPHSAGGGGLPETDSGPSKNSVTGDTAV